MQTAYYTNCTSEDNSYSSAVNTADLEFMRQRLNSPTLVGSSDSG